MDEAYVIEVKPSARRASPTAGEWVHGHGPRRTFASKALDREWARDASGDRLWVQDAAPHDPSAVDGYLVGGRRAGRSRTEGVQSTLG